MPDTEREEWRPIPGFPGYEASDLGRVRSWRVIGSATRTAPAPRILILSPNSPRGYLSFSPRRADGARVTTTVHVAVMLAFVGPPPEGMEVCHGPDPSPANNRLGNLRYDTRKGNLADRERHGTLTTGRKNGQAKLTDPAVREMARLRGEGETYEAIGRRFGVTTSVAWKAVTGVTWKHLHATA
jgi:hypothetical protein